MTKKKEVKKEKPNYEKMAIDGFLEFQALLTNEKVKHLYFANDMLEKDLSSSKFSRFISNVCNIAMTSGLLYLVVKLSEKL